MNDNYNTLRDYEREINQLKADLAKVQGANARLAAALNRLDNAWDNNSEVPYHCWETIHKLNQGQGSAALRDLLGPTVELLETLDQGLEGFGIKQELSRLRAIVGEKP